MSKFFQINIVIAVMSAACAATTNAQAQQSEINFFENRGLQGERAVGYSIQAQFDILDKRQCTIPEPGIASPFRYLIEVIGPLPAKQWRVLIQPGNNGPNGVRKDYKRRQLILSNENVISGQRFLTPVFDVDNGGHCLKILEGTPPEFRILAIIKSKTSTQALSIYGPKIGGDPNWIYAEHIWAKCNEKDESQNDKPCLLDYPIADPPDKPVLRQQLYAEDADGETISDTARRDRIAAVLRPVVWLGLERYDPHGVSESKLCTNEDVCMSHCTGVLIAPRLIATNAHCVLDDGIRGPSEPADYVYRYNARGWLRPLDNGKTGLAHELERAPDFQSLIPVFLGSPERKTDYTIFWVSDENMRGNGAVGFSTVSTQVPVAPSVSTARLDEDTPIAIVGYPLSHRLSVSFDEYCNAKMGADPLRHLAHQCDTAGGSSGSPIYDRNLSHVVGLHYGGFVADRDTREFECEDGDWANCYNYGVSFAAVRDDIHKNLNRAGFFKSGACDAVDEEIAPVANAEFIYGKELPGQRPLTIAVLKLAYEQLPPALKNDTRICSS